MNKINVPSIRRRPAEYAAVFTLAVIAVLTACGLSIPVVLSSAIVALVVVVVTGAVELFHRNSLATGDHTDETGIVDEEQ